MNNQPTSDPRTWPVVECIPTDVFLGVFDYDCMPALTEEQRRWTTVNCASASGPTPAAPGGAPDGSTSPA